MTCFAERLNFNWVLPRPEWFCQWRILPKKLFSALGWFGGYLFVTILVDGFNPSEKISQLVLLFPIYGKIKIMFQTTNQQLITSPLSSGLRIDAIFCRKKWGLFRFHLFQRGVCPSRICCRDTSCGNHGTCCRGHCTTRTRTIPGWSLHGFRDYGW